MASIVVTGGGMAGLMTAMLLADDGHEVTVIERDPAPRPSPADAWESWTRRGVTQFRLLHFLQARFRLEAERAVPRVISALEAAGAVRLDVIAGVPSELTGGPRPGDEAFTSVTARRPVAESVVAACAEATPGVTVRRGVAVTGLTTGTPAVRGVPHVTGVRTEQGDEIGADLVVDATGRRSPLPQWLEAVGGRRPTEEIEDSGFVYYGRHFRSSDGSLPPIIGGLLQNYGSVSALTLPADNGTWGVGLIASAADQAMRAVRDADAWSAVVRTLPFTAHWLEGEPLEDRIQVMAKIEDRHRRYVTDGEPVATGVVAVADSWACTNPSLGRGISMAMMHALSLRQVLHDRSLDDPVGFSRAWDEVTMATVEPWYRATVGFDRHRLAEIDAEIRGEDYRPDDPAWEIAQGLQFAAGQDPDCFRAFLSVVGVLETPEEAVARPGVFEKILELGSGWRDAPVLGPSRQDLLSTMAG
ncbi:MAG TPA: FAD-dependent monooxygenase [Acidimicrobiales bacterium]|nr:FAD-dependent monooxygenase [Acidimicrobiales bacterium]